MHESVTLRLIQRTSRCSLQQCRQFESSEVTLWKRGLHLVLLVTLLVASSCYNKKGPPRSRSGNQHFISDDSSSKAGRVDWYEATYFASNRQYTPVIGTHRLTFGDQRTRSIRRAANQQCNSRSGIQYHSFMSRIGLVFSFAYALSMLPVGSDGNWPFTHSSRALLVLLHYCTLRRVGIQHMPMLSSCLVFSTRAKTLDILVRSTRAIAFVISSPVMMIELPPDFARPYRVFSETQNKHVMSVTTRTTGQANGK